MASPAHIVLCTGSVEGRYLEQTLRTFSRTAHIARAGSVSEIRAALDRMGTQTRLISYCSSVIIPPDLLAALDGPAYNFHPGPPDYPGRFPAGFAAYDGARRFGVTAHEMVARVDAGAIIAAEYFDLPAGADLEMIETRAYQALAALFRRLAPQLLQTGTPLRRAATARWTGPTRTKAQFDALRTLDPSLSPEERARRKRAFGTHVIAPDTSSADTGSADVP